MSTANTSGAAAAPVPVSAARAECDAIMSASTAGALRRKTNGNDPMQRARHIADFIAGMTDQYAMAQYAEIFGERPDGLSNV